MSKLRRWLSGQELIERWNIGYLEVIDLISQSKLTAYTENGHEVDPKKPIDWKVGWKSAEYRVQELHFIRKEVEFYETINPNVNRHNLLVREINLRPNQKHRLEIRKIAELKWKNNPELTIVDIANDDEVNKKAQRKDGSNYAENTIRKWIKDLNPNPKPGRRRKTK